MPRAKLNGRVEMRQGWPDVTPRLRQAELRLDALPADDRDTLHNLSAGVRVGNTLFLGSDEGAALEIVHWDGGAWTGHERLSLANCLELPFAGEADIEGLAEDDGWLWVLGSHARTRPKLGKKSDELDLALLSNLNDTRPRCLLARLPLVSHPDRAGGVRLEMRDGDRIAGMAKPTRHGNALALLLAHDPLLKPFTRIPAKEGGVDLEGIAVAGPRVAIGMRGPMIHSYAVLLELHVGAKQSGRLKVGEVYRRRLLDLDGLGIRDLKRAGRDLLILAGPTTGLDGPCAVYRWPDWLNDPARHDDVVCLHRPDRIIELPFGRGCDHPEGLALLGDAGTELMVICDSPAPERTVGEGGGLLCDIFALDAAPDEPRNQ